MPLSLGQFVMAPINFYATWQPVNLVIGGWEFGELSLVFTVDGEQP